MKTFESTYLNEAGELLAEIEEILLNLEQQPSSENAIERIFRAMHTLKGNSSMFGFVHVGELTHELENIFDDIRQEKKSVNAELLNITLSSIDHLRALLNDRSLINPVNAERHETLKKCIFGLRENKCEHIKSIKHGVVPPKESTLATWYILFRPGTEIFKNGTNPLLLIDELFTLGETHVTAHRADIPDLEELDVHTCYTWWDIYLVTQETEQSIRDVFMFVDDICKIEIYKVADENLLGYKEFVEKIADIEAGEQVVDIGELQKYVNELLQIIRDNQYQEIRSGIVFTEKEVAHSASIRVDADKIDKLISLVSELVTSQAGLSLMAESSPDAHLLNLSEEIEKITRQLRDVTHEICLVPLDSIIIRLRRLVRDLSNELQKEVQFITEGADTELDMNMIHKLADPLMHIFRNAMDHGFESVDERKKMRKPEKCTLSLRAFYSGTNVVVEVRDDGKGIDTVSVRQKAIEKGLIQGEDNLSAKEIQNLILLPGFSTAVMVTDVSGRGVGLDVVQKKITELRGQLQIESEKGKGTTITIRLPLTLSMLDGLLVKVGETHFVIPLGSVEKCYEMKYTELDTAFNNAVRLDNRLIPFVHLRREFDFIEDVPDYAQIVLVAFEGKAAGLSVDQVIGEYQAVLKPLGKMYNGIDIVSGASILGNGSIALVLDPAKIIQYFDEKIQKNRLKTELVE
ncbi:MAG: chemotaxis protein CheA [Cyclobacteriaceae bacterium]|nr:chemotaxis protein CheA [Cyclobacteriaceae bacterium]